ncbi:MAG: hypothetical protein EON93_09330 [Burkholderiales bacterium]|nr:MAG: hypothetical protein EON93_09330 [Burkholderiales bacterium]
MDGVSTDKALSRIEVALARLERAVSRPPAGDADLRQRHEQLKTTVSQALAELDAVIARQQG